jgi:hypothetical protein
MIISIGDGRTIDHDEGALRVPPPEPKVKPPRKNRGRPLAKHRKGRSVTLRGFKYKIDPRPKDKIPKPTAAWRNAVIPDVPGMVEWRALRCNQIMGQRPGKTLGVADGLTKTQSEARWAEARRKAKRDMEAIKKKIDLSEAAEEALEATLTTMRSPMNQSRNLQQPNWSSISPWRNPWLSLK